MRAGRLAIPAVHPRDSGSRASPCAVWSGPPAYLRGTLQAPVDRVLPGPYSVHSMNTRDREDTLTLELLEEIGRRSDVSQRHLARRLGVALGLANSYLRRCVRKGYVKIQQAPANRYLYYLTPIGFAEKARLTGRYLQVSFDFYRRAAASCDAAFDACAAPGEGRVLLGGVSELAEIASLRAAERGWMIVGTYDSRAERERFLGRPVWREPAGIGTHDVRLLTNLADPAGCRERLGALRPAAPLLIPDILPVAGIPPSGD